MTVNNKRASIPKNVCPFHLKITVVLSKRQATVKMSPKLHLNKLRLDLESLILIHILRTVIPKYDLISCLDIRRNTFISRLMNQSKIISMNNY